MPALKYNCVESKLYKMVTDQIIVKAKVINTQSTSITRHSRNYSLSRWHLHLIFWRWNLALVRPFTTLYLVIPSQYPDIGQGGKFIPQKCSCSKSGLGLLNPAHQENSGRTINEAVLIFKCVMSIAIVNITTICSQNRLSHSVQTVNGFNKDLCILQ